MKTPEWKDCDKCGRLHWENVRCLTQAERDQAVYFPSFWIITDFDTGGYPHYAPFLIFEWAERTEQFDKLAKERTILYMDSLFEQIKGGQPQL